MVVHFWGVRGSVPTPQTPQPIQSKIMAAIQRVQPEDLVSPQSRAKFVSSLPDWIFGTTGGNTPCVEIKADGSTFLLDAGTGIRVFGKSESQPQDKHYNLFFSHFHWDHVQGLPFFDQAYNPKSVIDIYSPDPKLQQFLENQMVAPYFPVPFGAFTKNINFHTVEPVKPFKIGNVEINCCRMFHPGDSYSYSFTCNGKRFVYATDVELKTDAYQNNPDFKAVFENADCIALDSQYTVEEAYHKENWGHSAFCYAIDFAVHWHIKKIMLFHHEPAYDDKKLNSILQAARWYARYIDHSDVQVELARENLELVL